MDPNSRIIHDKSVLGNILGRTWASPGSKQAPTTTKYNDKTRKRGNGPSIGAHFIILSMIFVSCGCSRTHPRDRLFVCLLNPPLEVLWYLAERQMEYCLLLCQAHITDFGTKSVLSWFSTLSGLSWGASWLYNVLWGTLFEVLFFNTFELNRQAVSNSE